MIKKLLKINDTKKLMLIGTICIVLIPAIIALVILINYNITYDITFIDYDGTLLEQHVVRKGEIPVFNGTLERKSDSMYDYTFHSWDKPLSKATSNETYVAVYTSVLRDGSEENEEDEKEKEDNEDEKNPEDETNEDKKESFYYITFIDNNGIVLQKSRVKYGEMPSYNGKMEEKIEDGYKYTFKAWTPALTSVESAQTYAATYTRTKIEEATPVKAESSIIYLDAETRAKKTLKLEPQTPLILDGNGYKIGLQNSAVLSFSSPAENQTLDLTIYVPSAPSDKMFIGYVFNTSTNIFTAKYVNKYQIDFKFKGHGVDKTVEYAEGDLIPQPDTPTTVGWLFRGWYKEDTYLEKDKWDFGKDTVFSNISLHAKWVKERVIRLNVGEHGASMGIIRAGVGELIDKSLISDPSDSAYVFLGWYINEDFDNPDNEWKFDTDIVSDEDGVLNLYAKWKIAEYKVTFNVQGHGSAPEPKPAIHGGTIEAPDPSPSETGWVFKGWYKSSKCLDSELFKFNEDTITSNIYLFAKWHKLCTVNFIANGHGSSSMPDGYENIEQGNKIDAPTTSPSEVGWVFKGWYKSQNCLDSEVWDFANDKLSGDLDLYAKWLKACTVEFDTNYRGDGTGPGPITAEQGSKISKPDVIPEEDGWAFTGWYKDSACTTLWNFNSDTISDDTVLYAGWDQGIRVIYNNETGAVSYKDILSTATIKINQGQHGTFTSNPMIISLSGLTSLNLTDPQYIPTADTSWTFVGFAYDEENHIFTSKYAQTVYVNVESEDATKGTVTGEGEYLNGEDVTISASALNGFVFSGWKINNVLDASIEGRKTTRIISANSSDVYTATFSAYPSSKALITLNDGNKYRVLSISGSNALVVSMTNSSNEVKYYEDLSNSNKVSFNSYTGYKYENSALDLYMQSWYETLNDGETNITKPIYDAIIPTTINQNCYYDNAVDVNNMDFRAKIGSSTYGDSDYIYFKLDGSVTIGTRNVFAIDVQDIKQCLVGMLSRSTISYVDLNNLLFLPTETTSSFWLRSAKGSDDSGSVYCVSGGTTDWWKSFSYDIANVEHFARPAFHINLSSAGIYMSINN